MGRGRHARNRHHGDRRILLPLPHAGGPVPAPLALARHVWNKYGGDVLWCINEARKTSEPLVCQITFGIRGPDCYRVEMEGDRFMIRCPSWERWPTDPAPHWGPDGPPPWSR